MWAPDYRVVLGCEHGEAVASVGVQGMRVWVGGRERHACQWGAVAVHPAQRGRGLAAEAVRRADALCGDAPVLLYANPDVRAFYPRFDFRPASSWRFRLNRTFHPAGAAAALDPAAPDAAPLRAALVAAVAAAAPLDTNLAALDHGRILAWYYANGFARPLWRLDDTLWLVAGVEDGVLHVDEAIAPAPRDLLPRLPQLLNAPVAAVEFGWQPAVWLDAASASAVEPVQEPADLFLRGFSDWPEAPAALQPMART
jgi:predicted N-acetyltransferase YhbS